MTDDRRLLSLNFIKQKWMESRMNEGQKDNQNWYNMNNAPSPGDYPGQHLNAALPCFAKDFIWNYNADVVMDLKGGDSNPGTPVIAWKQKPNEQASNQLWHVQEVATGTENTYTIMNDQTKIP
ncbi:hypothetical protein L218DRAFT_948325 [Marasmius fiardii PR-910]|nr:hypothetical protein L218DRAFT_948325 [Marasmius fiardii PR-910]